MELSEQQLLDLFDQGTNAGEEAAEPSPAPATTDTQAPETAPEMAPEAAPVAAEGGEDGSFLGRVADVTVDLGRGAIGGLRDGVQEVGETIQWAAESAGNAVTGGHDVYYTGNDGFEWLTKEEVMQRDDVSPWQTQDLIGEALKLPEVGENTTMAGGLTRGITQFLAGYGVAGKAMKGIKAATKSGQVAKVMGQGAAADMIAFDAHEERLSDFLRENFGLADPITEYLSVDEDDSVLEGKLKNAIEGLGLGIATDGLIHIVKSFKYAKRVQAVDGDAAAAKVMNEAAEMIDETGQLSLFDSVSDPNIKDGNVAGPRKVVVKGGPEEAAEETVDSAAKSVTQKNAEVRTARTEEAPDVDVKAFQDSINYEMGMVRGGSQPDPDRKLAGSLFNFEKMDSDLSTKDYLNMASDAVPDELLKDKTTFAAMEAEARTFLADSIDVSPEVIDASLANMAQGMQKQQGVVLAGKQLVQSLSREIETLAYKIDAGNASDADYAKMVRLQSRAIEVSGNLKSVITGAAQTTAAGRIVTKDALTGGEINAADILKQLEDSVDNAGGQAKIRDLAREIMDSKRAGNGLPGVMRVTANRKAGGFWDVTNEIRINGLLSGPRTHAINAISNSLQLFLLPTEKVLGGVVGANPGAMREGAMQYVGITKALNDAVKASLAAGRRGRNIIDPEAAILEANGVDFRAIQSTSDNPYVRNIVNGLGGTIRLPSRALLMGDEFFKQLNYRSHLYAQLHGKAADLVSTGQIKKTDAAKWIDDRMRAGFARDGQATARDSIEHAREATFTNELRRGSLPKRVQDMSNQHPYLKIILPFVRTPTNLIVAFGQRTPLLHRTSKLMMAELQSGDAARVAAARGKLASGTMIWGSAITAAMSGTITGSGPSDPGKRQRLMETGWRPYSVKAGDKYISYERLDPFAAFFGIAADFAEIGGHLNDTERNNLAMAGFAAIANNLASKTWLQGVTEAMAVMTEPERRAERWINATVASYMPFSALSREIRKGNDDQLRDTKGDPNASWLELQSLMNTFKNQIPGYSKTLPARRSWVTGETITYPRGWGSNMVTPLGDALASMNPIYEGEWKKDPVLDELARLDVNLTPPMRSIRGVDLTPEQYETYVELNGKVRAKGSRRTMYQELERQFAQPTYDVGRVNTPDFDDPETDIRVKTVRRVISAYRRMAQEEMIRRYPEIAQKIGENNLQLQQNQRSLLSGVADLAGD